MIYDEEGGNVRGLLEAGSKIDIAEPEKLINTPLSKQYIRLKPEGYILYEGKTPDVIQVTVDMDEEKYDFNTVVQKSMPISEETILGYGYRPPLYKNSFYDAVLFFNNVKFMEEQYEHEYNYFPSINLFKVANKNMSYPVFERKTFDKQVIRVTGKTEMIGGLSYAEYIYIRMKNIICQ